jgi:hypothetical protein
MDPFYNGGLEIFFVASTGVGTGTNGVRVQSDILIVRLKSGGAAEPVG